MVQFLLGCTMVFNSVAFLVFFFSITVLYYAIPHRFRWALLLVGSYFFYMVWKPEWILLIIISTFINYCIARRMGSAKTVSIKKRYLTAGMLANFFLLFLFKYSIFLNESIRGLFTAIGMHYPVPDFDLILPMGISFYTFQAASYLIDVYWEKIKPVKHYGMFSLFITFFPQLVAGPIERSQDLIPQFYCKRWFYWRRFLSGLKVMIWGFFKKVVIADRVAILVNAVYNSPQQREGLALILATLLFTVQIYCDFSGYSDIALGAARCLGFQLTKNFDKPYFASSIKDFWRRWHITLSRWFLDYVYIPLGGNRKGKQKKYRNLMITFFASGLWHGANWTFVLWGGLHGIYQVIGDLTKPWREKRQQQEIEKHPRRVAFQHQCITFLLVAFAWIFFRANTIKEAFYIVGHLFSGWQNWFNLQYIYETVLYLGLNLHELKVVGIAMILLFVAEGATGKQSIDEKIEQCPFLLQAVFYGFITAYILTTGVFYHAGTFIYFQF